eukprot:CAMPEP_0113324930 /NCGR_PEP_ID=MMETSP0010_2-20120614/17383_1 /TAXON_ID=216773 ORGANISM="Corethron hystrix, Strain 308" /NCGR_SAMPLE_ID=MMETSP0010_2 /ASSEMBLY_ACC=CAM_ASM_000155 /LENGTH=104 /DNA_ID=CAMNT_0000184493 /DNA_START=58 /DNA_END=369 /DNA_ORIENTATION=+ /assembly_acc=CAM_ASM_000155
MCYRNKSAAHPNFYPGPPSHCLPPGTFFPPPLCPVRLALAFSASCGMCTLRCSYASRHGRVPARLLTRRTTHVLPLSRLSRPSSDSPHDLAWRDLQLPIFTAFL